MIFDDRPGGRLIKIVSLMSMKKHFSSSIVEVDKFSDAAIPNKILIVRTDAVSANVSK